MLVFLIRFLLNGGLKGVKLVVFWEFCSNVCHGNTTLMSFKDVLCHGNIL